MAESPTDRCCIDAPHCTCAYEAAVDALNTYLRDLPLDQLAVLLEDAGLDVLRCPVHRYGEVVQGLIIAQKEPSDG